MTGGKKNLASNSLLSLRSELVEALVPFALNNRDCRNTRRIDEQSLYL